LRTRKKEHRVYVTGHASRVAYGDIEALISKRLDNNM
jgi:hypothetical protein